MRRIAIINRGDAASRCLQAIKELRAEEGGELEAIALYTEPDRNAPFVRQADAALSLGPALRGSRGSPPRPAYLDRARVLAALRATRADAAWPGWGFLAEDPDFVELVENRGITFIGPSSRSMRLLADKTAAKGLAAKAGVAVVPWSGAAVTADTVSATAQRLGFPLFIKAVAGGGGRGIRMVERAADLAASLAQASAEAAHAFGDEAVFLEALIRRPRHIEVQIAADCAGHCMALGLRDCSIQRRHQKLIEESPPPHLAAPLATAMREAAVRIAAAAGYCGVGTVEFLLAPHGDFYFLEANPRLQVEHGLTEALTGIDLVRLQITLARGEHLPAAPVVESGHAIEARVCAEDPHAAFAPTPGTVVLLDLPTGTGVRTDCGVSAGSVIPAEFDQLIAKVIAHAPTRQAARARLACALENFRLVLAGGATNKGFLLELLSRQEVREGAVDVEWLDRTLAALPPPRYAAEALIVASILTYLSERATARLNFFAEAAGGPPRSVPHSTGQTVDLTYGGQAYRPHVLAIGDWGYRVQLDAGECVATLLEQEDYACQLVIGDERFGVTCAASEGGFRIEVNGQPHVIGRDTGGQVRASAPSVVIAIDVAAGDHVAAGQRLGLLEAMKVESAFTAPTSGTVTSVQVRRNERVAAGAVLLVIRPEDATAAVGRADGRIALPAWDDPLRLLYDADGKRDLAGLARRAVPTRERALDALTATVRHVLLGYDASSEREALIHDLLEHPLPTDVEPSFLAELAGLRTAVTVFADTEILFWRQPSSEPGGAMGPSNDAWLRLYLRRTKARGAGIPESFLELLRRALAHYDVKDRTPGEELERALLRLYAAQARSRERHRLVGDVLRYLTRLAGAGVDLGDDGSLNGALGTCVVLRGKVPDALADAAAEARYTIFELPQIRRRARAANVAVEGALAALEERGPAAVDLETLSRLSDSPPEVFDRIGAWTTAESQTRRDVALQALVLRQYAPQVPSGCQPYAAGRQHLARVEYPDCGTVLAGAARPDGLLEAWQALCEAARKETAPPALELHLSVEAETSAEQLREWMARLLASHPPVARRLCVTAFESGGGRTHLTYEPGGGSLLVERTELLGLHPESARRLDLLRLCEFALERLPAPEGVYAFFGRSHRMPGDERIFVVAEVRAALPGSAGTMHEPAFVHAFTEAARVLRNVRGERQQWRRLQWNRITMVVRPALYLLPATLDRLVGELLPATRHLGLEKIVVRLALRDSPSLTTAKLAELVVEPAADGAAEVSWRDPHAEPLRPASPYEHRVAQARRRGVVYPYEAIRLFTSAGAWNGSFEEFDLDPDSGAAISVGGRAPGENRCGIVFGLISTVTAKFPQGMRRVAVFSDPTQDMGALSAAECDRIVAALDLTAARRLPLEWLAVSAGARIAMDSGTENLDAVARVVRRIVNFTQEGGEINLIVPGTNVGGQSYFNALATMLMHTRGILVMTPQGSIVLTGRLALEASGSVAAEDEIGIGGYERVMGPNGQAQYYARDLSEAYEILMQHYRYTYVDPGESGPRRHATADRAERPITSSPYLDTTGEGFEAVGEIFDDRSNPARKRPFAMRQVMRALVDADGGWLERWQNMRGADTAIVWDCHLGGHAICLIGIESRPLPRLGYGPNDGPDQWSGGTLFPLSSKKVARALNGASDNRPAVLLANLSGFDGSPESMRKLQLEYGAEIARAVVNFRGPLLFVVVSRYHGGAYVVFSHELNDELFAVALAGSYASVIGGSAAATVIFPREVQRRAEADPSVVALCRRLERTRDPIAVSQLRAELEQLRSEVTLEKQGEVAHEFDEAHSVERACEVGSLHAIVPPERLRALLIEHLDAGVARRRK